MVVPPSTAAHVAIRRAARERGLSRLLTAGLARAPCAWLVLLLVGTACHAPSPRIAVDSPWGEVRADELSTAANLVQDLERMFPRVRDLLPATRDVLPEIWVQDVPTYYRWWEHDDADGFFVPGTNRIHLRALAANGTLEHELVHLLLDETWSTLPAAVEEGLCDLVSVELVPSTGPAVRASRASGASLALGGLTFAIDYRGWTSLARISAEPVDPLGALASHRADPASATRDREVRGVGFLVAERIVERHGYRGLLALCDLARRRGLDAVPASTLAQAADLAPGTDEVWRDAIRETVSAPELRRLALRFEQQIAEQLVRDAARMDGPIDEADFFARAAPRLRLLGDVESIPLGDLTPIRAAFEDLRRKRANR